VKKNYLDAAVEPSYALTLVVLVLDGVVKQRDCWPFALRRTDASSTEARQETERDERSKMTAVGNKPGESEEEERQQCVIAILF
jgi:hypothetical protein